MSRKQHVPKYCHHKPSARGYARFGPGAKPTYFPGRYDSKESRAAYHRALAEYLAGGRPGPAETNLTVRQVLAAWVPEARRRYRKFDRPTSELSAQKCAWRFLRELYADLPARDFGPGQLAAVRQRMVAEGWVRSSINLHVCRIRAIWKWAVSQSMVPEASRSALRSVAGLRKGKSDAREPEPRRPPTWQQLLAVLRRCSREVGAMVRLQYLTGMRPVEVCSMRAVDVDRSGDLWKYTVRPEAAKTGKEVYWLGPRAQAALARWLLMASGDGGRVFHYTRSAYTRHIVRCCQAAGVRPFSAHALRHSFAVRAVDAHGRDAAAGALNHSDPMTTGHYSRTASAAQRRIARELG